MKGHIFLTGFMGAGKSTVGRILADLLGRTFLDTDEMLAEETGRSAADIIARRGEEYFRDLETALLRRISRRRRPAAAAAGGGTVIRRVNREIMRRCGTIVFLDCSPETAADRLQTGSKGRPLWKDGPTAARLFEQRREAYLEADLIVDVNELTPLQTAQTVLAGVFPERRFSISPGGDVRPVCAVWTAGKELARLAAGRRVALITDHNVRRLHGERIAAAVEPDLTVSAPSAEKGKRLDPARRIHDRLLDAGMGRGDVLIGLGGRMVAELVVFAAAYESRFDFILVYTALAGCADAAIGGAAGVIPGPSANPAAALAPPQAVLIDFTAFKTLQKTHVREGLIEAYQTGLAADPDLAGYIESDLTALLNGDAGALSRVAVASVEAAARLVEDGMVESDRRIIRGPGRAYARALADFHPGLVGRGRAAAAGLEAAANISEQRGLLNSEQARRVRKTIRAIVPGPAPALEPEDAWNAMHNEQKSRGGRLAFVLLAGPGKPTAVDDLSRAELAAALKLMGR